MPNYSIDNCIKWNKNKLINPITNNPIKVGSVIYNDIEKQCTKYIADSSIFNNFCKNNKISSNQILNSNERIIYDKFIKFCKNIKKEDKKVDKKEMKKFYVIVDVMLVKEIFQLIKKQKNTWI